MFDFVLVWNSNLHLLSIYVFIRILFWKKKKIYFKYFIFSRALLFLRLSICYSEIELQLTILNSGAFLVNLFFIFWILVRIYIKRKKLKTISFFSFAFVLNIFFSHFKINLFVLREHFYKLNKSHEYFLEFFKKQIFETAFKNDVGFFVLLQKILNFYTKVRLWSNKKYNRYVEINRLNDN